MSKSSSERVPSVVALQLAVVGSGMYTGVMLAIGLGLGRYWLGLPPAEFVAWFTPNFWFLLPTVGVTLPIALAGTIASLVQSRGQPTARSWRIILGLLLVTIVVTLVYHLPANIRIWSGTLDDAQARAELNWWMVAHVLLRIAPALAATWLGVAAAVGAKRSNA